MLKKRKWQNQEEPKATGVFGLVAFFSYQDVQCSYVHNFCNSQCHTSPIPPKAGCPQGCSDPCVGVMGSAAVSSPCFPSLLGPQAWLPQCFWSCSCKAANINTVVTTAFKICDQETKRKRKQERISEEMLDWMFSGYEAYIKYFLWLPVFTSSIYHHH